MAKRKKKKQKKKKKLIPNFFSFIKEEYQEIIAVVLTSFVVYIYTAAPTIFFGDSPEIVTAVKLLAVPHPTGFPTYLLLAKLFSFLPLGEFAYRLNIFSGVITAINVGLIYLFIRRLSISKLPAAIASLTFAFGQTVWLHATYAQTYSMAHLFGLILLHLALEYKNNPQNKYIYYFFFFTGLGLGSHFTVVLFAFGGILMLMININSIGGIFKKFLYGLPFFLLGLMIFAYIPIRASQNPPINWGEPDNYQRFVDYITQKQWKYMMFDRSGHQTIIFIKKIITFSISEFTPAGILLALSGIYFFFARNKGVFSPILAISIANIMLFFIYGNQSNLEVLFRYFLALYTTYAIFMAFAIEKIKEIFDKSKKLTNLKIPIISVFLLLPIANLVINYSYSSNRGNTFALDHARNILMTIPEQGNLFLKIEDDVFPILYTRYVLHEREDINYYDRSGNVFDRHYNFENAYSLNEVEVEKIKNEKDIEILGKSANESYFTDQGNSLISYVQKGILYKAGTGEEEKIYDTDSIFSYYKLPDEKDIHKYFKYREELARYYLYRARGYFLEGKIDQSKEYIKKALNISDDAWFTVNFAIYLYLQMGDENLALETLESATKTIPHLANTYYHIGAIRLNQNNIEQAKTAFKKALEIEPSHSKSKQALDSLAYYKPDSEIAKSIEVLEKQAEELKATDPKRAEIYLSIGAGYGQMGETQKAIEHFQKSIEIDDTLVNAHINLGNAYMNLVPPNPILAIGEFEKVIELDPKISMAYLNLGSICLYNLINYDCTIKYWENYLELEPNSKEAESIRKEIERIKSLK